MWKITLLFESNISGVYTKEEETSTDVDLIEMKYERMIDRWYKIIAGHIDISEFSNEFEDPCELKLQVIKNEIDKLNKKDEGTRKFSIDIRWIIK